MRENVTSIVIPVADEPRNETLPIALETIRRHLPWTRIVLVGPPTLVEQYVKRGEGEHVLPVLAQERHKPVANTTRMLLQAAADPIVTDTFLWSADDIYFRDTLTLDELWAEARVASGDLSEIPSKGIYGSLAALTRDELRRRGRPTWNYERHVPLVARKQDVAEIVRVGVSPRSLYLNTLYDWPERVARDVKAFTGDELRALKGPIISSGNRIPVQAIQRALN